MLINRAGRRTAYREHPRAGLNRYLNPMSVLIVEETAQQKTLRSYFGAMLPAFLDAGEAVVIATACGDGSYHFAAQPLDGDGHIGMVVGGAGAAAAAFDLPIVNPMLQIAGKAANAVPTTKPAAGRGNRAKRRRDNAVKKNGQRNRNSSMERN